MISKGLRIISNKLSTFDIVSQIACFVLLIILLFYKHKKVIDIDLLCFTVNRRLYVHAKDLDLFF